MNIRHTIAIAVSGLALNASAQVVSALYDFNNSDQNPVYQGWYGSNGWSASATEWYLDTYEGGPDGTPYVAYDFAGAGWGGTASRTFNAPTTNEQFSLGFSYLTVNYWGTSLGFGSSASAGFNMTATNYLGSRLAITSGGTTASGDLTFSEAWHDFRVDIDLGANGGSGSASFYEKASSESAWALIDGLANINLDLDQTRTASDDSNPLNWDTLWFHLEGAGSGIDNISVSAIPEPSTYAAMAGAAALGLAMWRCRRSAAAQQP